MSQKRIETIWLVNKYAMPPQYESRLRTIKFAHYLTQAGYKVYVFGSSVMHNMGINLIEDGKSYIKKKYGDINFVHIKTLNYYKSSGIARILSDLQFHYKLCSIANHFEKPDLIVASTYPYFCNPLMDYAKKNRIKYITESLDVYPDNFVDFGLINPLNPLMKRMYRIAKRNYAESDFSVISWPGCYQYMINKKWDKDSGGPVDLKKIFYINNGVDLNDFNKWKEENTLDDIDLKSDKKRITYLGSVRLVNNVMQFIKAAELFADRDDLLFLIFGDGPDRILLEDYCKKHNLRNIKFKDKWIDPKLVPYVVSQSYINILNYVSSDFAKYGISSSKMFQYFAAGKPILCNINILYCPITANNIGIARELTTPESYAAAIDCLLSLSSDEYNAMCERVYNTAKEYDYEYLTNKFIGIIKKLEQ